MTTPVTNPASEVFLNAVSAATADTGNALANSFLGAGAFKIVNDANTEAEKVAAAAKVTLATVAAPVPAKEVVAPPVAAMIAPETAETSSLSSKVLSAARKTTKAVAITAVIGTLGLLVTSALTPAVCAIDALAGGAVCEAVLPSAVALNTGLATGTAALLATASHISQIGLRQAIANYQDNGSIYAPGVEETVYYYTREIAATGIALAGLGALAKPEYATAALEAVTEATKKAAAKTSAPVANPTIQKPDIAAEGSPRSPSRPLVDTFKAASPSSDQAEE